MSSFSLRHPRMATDSDVRHPRPMNPSLPAAPATVPLRLPVHLLVGVAVGIISPFTGLAWPFALLTGFLLGSDDARRMRGEHQGALDAIALGIVGAGGIIAMLFFGAIIGGIIAIGVLALAVFSERAAAFASPTDRGVARILLFVIPVAMWFVLFPLLGLTVDIDIG
jgi:hypothetical protein